MPRISSCAARLTAALHVRGMKQVELCNRTGIPKSAMSQYLKGAFEPKKDRLEAMARVLNVNEAWLMGYDGVPMERKEEENRPPLLDVGIPFGPYKIFEGDQGKEGDFEGDFKEFLRVFAEETKNLSFKGRNDLLRIARYFRQEEEKRNRLCRD